MIHHLLLVNAVNSYLFALKLIYSYMVLLYRIISIIYISNNSREYFKQNILILFIKGKLIKLINLHEQNCIK